MSTQTNPTWDAAHRSLRSRTLRHAAALALVGWYLLAPPISTEFPQGNSDAPLTHWTKVGSALYKTKDDCERALDKRRRLTNQRNRQVTLRHLSQADCVATDDPRLKSSK